MYFLTRKYTGFRLQQVIYYRLQTKLREGNVFTGMCHSVHGGRYSRTFPQSPRTITPPPRLYPSLPPTGTLPPPPLGRTAKVGVRYPTGMLSCLMKNFSLKAVLVANELLNIDVNQQCLRSNGTCSKRDPYSVCTYKYIQLKTKLFICARVPKQMVHFMQVRICLELSLINSDASKQQHKSCKLFCLM